MNKFARHGIYIVIILFIAGIVGWYAHSQKVAEIDSQINSFEDCAAAGYPIMESYPEQCRTRDGRNFTRVIESQNITVSGEIVCLPHKDTGGPQTLECAFGVMADSGEYYGLFFDNQEDMFGFETGRIVEISGVLESTSESRYDILGTIRVDDIK